MCVIFSRNIEKCFAANAVPNLMIFSQPFIEISPNEVTYAVFGPLCKTVKSFIWKSLARSNQSAWKCFQFHQRSQQRKYDKISTSLVTQDKFQWRTISFSSIDLNGETDCNSWEIVENSLKPGCANSATCQRTMGKRQLLAATVKTVVGWTTENKCWDRTPKAWE